MKKLFVVSVWFLFFITCISAQEVALNPGKSIGYNTTSLPEGNLAVIEIKVDWLKTDELNAVSDDLVDQHDFGTLVAKKIYLLDKIYTYQVAISPGNPSKKTMIRKPVVYNSVVEVEKYLKKLVRKKELLPEMASQYYNQVLDIALNTYSAKTDQLEEAIANSKTSEELLSIYTKFVRIVN